VPVDVCGGHLIMIPLPREFLRESPPIIAVEAVPNCPVCLGDRQRTYAAGYDYELATCGNEWHFVQCDACQHVWLNPRPAVSELSRIYPPHYYAYNYQSAVNPIARWGKEWLDRGKLAGIIRRLTTAPASYLDVGCGDGRFLKVMARQGVPAERNFGLELDAGVVARLRAEGFPGVFCERVETARDLPSAGIDLATMFHVIEHVADPGAVVRRIADWLVPGGALAIETPNLDSLDARLFRRTYWGGYHFPRHWNLFTPASLSRLVTAQGLQVESITYQTGHSFWMYSLHHWLRHGRGRPRLGRCFDPLRGLLPLVAFTGFDRVRSKLGGRTSAMLLIARRPG
jgi:2-polyprenyl-3-methyl-5-hydroxy-6-metoxy-1,4-benzoquinol methylase